MPAAFAEKEPREAQPLTGRPQTISLQERPVAVFTWLRLRRDATLRKSFHDTKPLPPRGRALRRIGRILQADIHFAVTKLVVHSLSRCKFSQG